MYFMLYDIYNFKFNIIYLKIKIIKRQKNEEKPQ